jgi:hypothetical protein
VLCEEKHTTGPQNSRNLCQDLLGIHDRAEHQGRYHGVDAGIVEGNPLGWRFKDRIVEWRSGGSLPELGRHVRVRLSQQHLRDILGVVTQIEPGAGPQFEHPTSGTADKVLAYSRKTSPLCKNESCVVHQSEDWTPGLL